MTRVLRTRTPKPVVYPDSDGKPMGETPRHIKVMLEVFQILDVRHQHDDDVFTAANMFVYYEEGNARKHVSPDVFQTRGVPRTKTPERRSYRTWEEGGRGPSLVVEITSESTRDEDKNEKFRIYQDVLKVQEYFLFDPYGEYLEPTLIGYRLVRGKFVRIKPVKGRLPSKVLGLHLEASGGDLRLYDPKTGRWLPTIMEQAALAQAELSQAEVSRQQAEEGRQQAEESRQQAEEGRQQAEEDHKRAEEAREQAEAEAARLRRELEALRQHLRDG